MKKYVLDSNVYIAAARNREFGLQLADFAASFLPQISLHAIVMQELLRGALDSPARRRLEKDVLDPFEKRGRVIVPSLRAWKRSGEVVAELVERGVATRGSIPASFINDVLLATSCRDAGYTLITMNTSDFERISTAENVSYVPPWPSA